MSISFSGIACGIVERILISDSTGLNAAGRIGLGAVHRPPRQQLARWARANPLSGRVAVAEKPNVLWDRPDLERLYRLLVAR
jgi:hypothetical protein